MKNEMLQLLDDLSYAFYTLNDRVRENMPDFGCGCDDYAEEVEEAVSSACGGFAAAEKKLREMLSRDTWTPAGPGDGATPISGVSDETYKELSASAVKSITLLSVEEYKEAKEHIPPLDEWWWLRSPGYDSTCAADVNCCGDINTYGSGVNFDDIVRPALRLDPQSVDLEIGDRFRFGGKTWTYIAEGLALSDEAFREMSFREDWGADDANVYEASDVKAYLDGWLEEVKKNGAR